MATHNVVNIQKISSWKICEWVTKQNRTLVFPLPASFPSSSYFFANFSSISHMRSMKVNIFLHKLVLASKEALCDFVGKGEKHSSTQGKPNAIIHTLVAQHWIAGVDEVRSSQEVSFKGIHFLALRLLTSAFPVLKYCYHQAFHKQCGGLRESPDIL